MYIILLAISMALVGAGVIFWICHMKRHPKWMETLIAILLIPAVAIFAIWAAVFGTSGSDRLHNQEEYSQLKLYQYTVENSTNEYLRYDYYERVQEWNERYETIKENESDPWLSWFYFDPMEGCGPIDFVLHGDEAINE